MFCNKCGKELPDGSKFCNYCGAQMPESAPRHARPEPEEIFSYSDENARSEYDVSEEMTKVYGPDDGLDQTKVYNFENFEEKPGSSNVPEIDEREIIDDSFDNYTEDDDTFMDKMDKKFRRDDYDRPPQKSHTWVWVVLGVVAVVLIAVIAILAVSGAKNSDKKQKPTAATTATQQVTEKPTDKPTEKPTEAPQTEAPAPTEAPQTEAPAPTEAPQTEAPEPEPETETPTPEPETDAPDPDTEIVVY